MSKLIYISGKITGMEATAAALFEKAEAEIIAMGCTPVNPLKLEHKHNGTCGEYMREDIKYLLLCDAIYFLPNWGDSPGARLEYQIAAGMDLEMLVQGK